MKKICIFLIINLLAGILFFPKTKFVFAQNNISPTRQVVVYEAPKYFDTQIPLTSGEVVSKFSDVLYSRNQMRDNLTGYREKGFDGNALIYIIADQISGPNNLHTVISQKTLCTEDQKNQSVWSSFADMDLGDFCEIHDAIIKNTSLPDYPDIYPTENWFLHKADGTRFFKPSSTQYIYRPNPGDLNWQKYYARRALREMMGGEEVDHFGNHKSHLAIPGVTGLFIDNLQLSWGNFLANDNNGLPPIEYTTEKEYLDAVFDFSKNIYATLHTANYNYQVWANMIYDPNSGSSWDRFSEYLDGAMNESFALNWGQGPFSAVEVQKQMQQVENFVNQGKNIIAVVQGDVNKEYLKYSLGVYLLTTDGVKVSYKYSGQKDIYADYYDSSDFYLKLGMPLESKIQISDNPIIYQRQFDCGIVTVDITNHTANFEINNSCSTFTVDDLKSALNNYLGTNDQNYEPKDGKINALDIGFVIGRL